MKLLLLLCLLLSSCTTIVTDRKRGLTVYNNFAAKTRGVRVTPQGFEMEFNDATKVPLSIVRTAGMAAATQALAGQAIGLGAQAAGVENAKTAAAADVTKAQIAADVTKTGIAAETTKALAPAAR